MANRRRSMDMALAMVIAGMLAACGSDEPVLTFSGSAVGREGRGAAPAARALRARNPGHRVVLQRHARRRRPAPSALRAVAQRARERARRAAARRDLDAGVRRRRLDAPLDRFQPQIDDFFPRRSRPTAGTGAVRAAVVRRCRHALLPHRSRAGAAARRSPSSVAPATRARADGAGVRPGLAGRALRRAGHRLLEYLAAFGGRSSTTAGAWCVDSGRAPAGADASCAMPSTRDGIVPHAALAWQEEQTRFAFQNGHALVHAQLAVRLPLLDDRAHSAVAGGSLSRRARPGPAARDGRARRLAAGDQRAQRSPEAAYALIDVPAAAGADARARAVAGQFPRGRRCTRRHARRGAADSAGRRAADHRARGAAAGDAGLQPSSRSILQMPLHRA